MSITIKPYLHIPIIKNPTTTTPLINYPTTVSAAPRRGHTTNFIKARYSGEEIGGLGHAVLSAIKSNTIESPSNTTSTENRNRKPEKRKEKLGIGEEERTITGSDVLWALQKATTVKKKKKKKIVKKKKTEKNGDETDYNNSSGSDEDEEDYYSNVKPLNVKDEWIHSLDDLDLRLKQLSEI